MPLPPDLQGRVADRDFWRALYGFDSEDGPDEPFERVLRFEVTARHALVLQIEAESHSLGLSTDGAEPVEIAWDDQAHWHPHVLRWRELDAIGSAIADRDPTLAHPGVPLLLLMRFAPITDADDGRLALHLADRAWSRLRLFPKRERGAFFDRIDVRGAGFRWRGLGRGHVIEQDEDDRRRGTGLYSLRTEGNAGFPFESMEDMLSSIRPSSTSPPEAALPPRPLSLSFTLTHSASLPREAAHFVGLFLDRALHDAGAGGAEIVGSHSKADGTPISWRLLVSTAGDEAAARARVAGLLDACGVLASAACDGGGDLKPADRRFYVQLCNISLVRWGAGHVRFDRPRLTGKQRRALSDALDRLGFSPADDQGLRSLSLAVGGTVEAGFPDLVTGKGFDGGSLWLSRLSDPGAEVVYALMTAASLFVAAPLIAPSPAQAAAVNTPWPGTHVAADAAEVLALFQQRASSE